MSTLPNQTPNEQSDAKPEDVPPEQAGSESPEEEEEGECGFCLFMKGGGCKDAFIDWENCVQEAESNNEDLLDKCAQVTAALKRCMDAHADYYEPILRAEKLAEEQAILELEKENQNSQPNDPLSDSASSQHHKAEKVAEEQAIIEVEKEKQNWPPAKPQSPSSSNQDQKIANIQLLNVTLDSLLDGNASLLIYRIQVLELVVRNEK